MPKTNTGYAVIDVETTGLYNSDRIIEVAVVTLDHQLRTVDEYDTLVDPERDLGPTHIHGISQSMISMAPRFSEIAAVLARRIENRTLVAHNISFDARMLRNEFKRLGAAFDSGIGICTLRHTREKLPLACESFGIKPPQHHRALSDARATTELLRAIRPTEAIRPILVNDLATELNLRTHRRCADGSTNVLDRMLSRMTYEGVDPAYLAYVDLLDWALDDFVITNDERKHLEFVAAELNLGPVQIEQAHQEYFQALVDGAQKDGVVTADEHHSLTMVANALGIRRERVPAVTDQNDEFAEIEPGSSICFTGSFVDRNGAALSKRAIQYLASTAGYQVVSSVTKSKCDVLVAVDPSSNSGKTKKARAYGKPVVSAERFLTLL